MLLQVYLILDEFIMGGELQETSKKVGALLSCGSSTGCDNSTQSSISCLIVAEVGACNEGFERPERAQRRGRGGVAILGGQGEEEPAEGSFRWFAYL